MKNVVLSLISLSLCCAGLAQPACADSLYDRVLKTEKIRAGYAPYPPIFMKDPNTKKFSGIGFEVLSLAARKIGLKLELTEAVTWGTMIEGLRTNRYDMIATPVWAVPYQPPRGQPSKP